MTSKGSKVNTNKDTIIQKIYFLALARLPSQSLCPVIFALSLSVPFFSSLILTVYLPLLDLPLPSQAACCQAMKNPLAKPPQCWWLEKFHVDLTNKKKPFALLLALRTTKAALKMLANDKHCVCQESHLRCRQDPQPCSG